MACGLSNWFVGSLAEGGRMKTIRFTMAGVTRKAMVAEILELRSEIRACHNLLDERGLAVGSEFHEDLLRRVGWIAGAHRLGPKLKLENEKLKQYILSLETSIRDIAIHSLWYCEEKYGHDDFARINLEAALEETCE